MVLGCWGSSSFADVGAAMKIRLPYLLAALVLGTFLSGMYGWLDALEKCSTGDLRNYCNPTANSFEFWLDVLYLTLLAFSLEVIYSPPANFAIGMARFFGGAALAIGVIEIILLMFSGRWERLIVRLRKPDIVLAGIQPLSGTAGAMNRGGSKEALACLMGEHPIPVGSFSLPLNRQQSGNFEGRQNFVIDRETGKVEQKSSGKLMWEG